MTWGAIISAAVTETRARGGSLWRKRTSPEQSDGKLNSQYAMHERREKEMSHNKEYKQIIYV